MPSQRVLLHAFVWLSFASVVVNLRAADERVDFNRQIRPILADRCFACHGPDNGAREAELRLDLRQSAIESAITPGDSDQSELFRRVTSDDTEERMPPAGSNKKPLSDKEAALIRRWIDQGVHYLRHWSYIPPARPAVPVVSHRDWPRGEIDAFILRRLEAAGIKPSPRAESHVLLRRLYFDLSGLPPGSAAASFDHQRYDHWVDRLLASPRFGERMAMYWFDLVRYADTVGYHGDQVHNISPYRDYVISAFNRNLPFDQFTREQIAGDLLPNATEEQRIATGYNRLLQTSHEGGVQPKEYLAKYSADRVRNFSEVWLGGTLGCAECHDHKYDPYTQRDFYSLAAFFADIDEAGHFKKGTNSNPTARPPELDVLSPTDRQLLRRIQQRRAAISQQLERGLIAPSERGSVFAENRDPDALRAELESLSTEAERVNQRRTRTMIAAATTPRTIRIFPRGDWLDESGPEVQPSIPSFLPPLTNQAGRPTRLDLANWLARRDHPLTARVMVNRLWALFFGTGLSNVLDDLGSQGEPPTHPELLDWLAIEFIESGWDVKHIVRLIVTSNTYQQASLERPELKELDPENRLLARQSRYRLPAELIRDNALSISGLLVEELGGATARPYQPAGYYANLNFPQREYQADGDANQYRRGVYTHWQRQFLHPMLKAFDAPSREECMAQRVRSNTPSAALALLNDPSFVEAARMFAQRIMRLGGDTIDSRITWAWHHALNRSPTETERSMLRQLLEKHTKQFRENPESTDRLLSTGRSRPRDSLDRVQLGAWTSIVRVILNLNETITRN